MKSWIIQPPEFIRRLFFKSLWRLPEPSRNKTIALTFDDGPVPEQTPWVLDLLDQYGIKATFFCVGDNVRKHPGIFEEIVRRGHTVGNHTFNHLQLIKNSWQYYAENIEMCNQVQSGKAHLFRAPHGQITPWRAWQITHSMHFDRLVFWDVMPKDYDNRLTPQEVYSNVRQYVRDGSLIVFHDSIKAGERMRYALQQTIEYYQSQGWQFVALDISLF